MWAQENQQAPGERMHVVRRGSDPCHWPAPPAGHKAFLHCGRRSPAWHVDDGYRLIGFCLLGEGGGPAATFEGRPVLGELGGVADVVSRHEVDTVAVLPCPELDGPTLRRLGRELEKTPTELLLAPAATEVVGTRVQIRPVCGCRSCTWNAPISRESPSLPRACSTGRQPLWPARPDACPGRDGMLNQGHQPRPVFPPSAACRPGRADALDAEVPQHGHRRRPHGRGCRPATTVTASSSRRRTTHASPRPPVAAAVLTRRVASAVDVVRGEMSLVGRRPPLPSEFKRYEFDMHRRFLVKLGLTGVKPRLTALSQVSGRSDLSWDDSVRIDVRSSRAGR